MGFRQQLYDAVASPAFAATLTKDNPMTDLPPVQYLEQSAFLANFEGWEDARINALPDTEASIIAHARALHENAQLRAEIAALRPRETLEQVARRECEAFRYVWRGLAGSAFEEGFLRAAEMAKAGELPDE